MPYRTLSLRSHDGIAETHHVRVSDGAVAEWLHERARLRSRGYPDRPPDIDSPTLRAWLPRIGEQALPYFRDRALRGVPPTTDTAFPVFTATWHAPDDALTKVIVHGLGDGGFLIRVVIVNAAGECPVDKAHHLDPDIDPNAVWAEIETIVTAINEAPMGWGPGDPLVTTYPDFLALDAEVQVAEEEARAAGLLSVDRLH